MERLSIDLTKFLDKTALIHHKHDKTSVIIKYKELLKQLLKVGLVIESEKISNLEANTIGIICKKNPSAVAIALAIIEADFAFCFVSNEQVPYEPNKLGFKYFFSDEPVMETNNLLILRNSLEVFGQKIFLYQTSSSESIKTFNNPSDKLCYTITTSGTTGQRKVIRVTYDCIASNVVCLQKIFRLHNDVIYSSAPCTFDVFVLDLFLALHSGSALMMLDETLRYSDESLNLMFSSGEATGVTFMQVTPSLFQQYGIENIKKILCRDSSLKFLVLGGEQFPSTKEVITWQNWDDILRKRIFNVYGVTEMSCWGMIHEVTSEDLKFGDVALGELLDDTGFAFKIEPEGKLGLEELVFVTDRRICLIDDKQRKKIDDEQALFAFETGDLVKRKNGKIYYFGRKNEIIKKYGERINLGNIERVASKVMSSVACIYMKKKIVLFAQAEEDNEIGALKKYLSTNLESKEFPDDIRRIIFFPLSENGKISKQKLKEIYKEILLEDRENRKEIEETFLEAINQIFSLQLNPTEAATSDEPDGKKIRTEMDSTFRALGGSSFDALRISMKLEDQTGMSNSLLPKLLGDDLSIRDICHYLKDLSFKEPKSKVVHLEREFNVQFNKVTNVVRRFDLQKCVDASPALVWIRNQPFITVGSHSSQLITISAKNVTMQSETKLGDRIECEVAAMGDRGIVGCYDENLYCFGFQSGAMKWKFASGGMIKAKPLVIGNLVIFGNYNAKKNLRCLQVEGEAVSVKWEKLVGSRGILAAPLQINPSTVLVCSLDGIIEFINIDDGKTIWSKKLESPIFSSPRKISSRNEFVIAEVSKKVHCIDFEGNILWEYEADGQIFSSFVFHQENEAEIKIIFGCHDKKLRCLNYNYEQQTANLLWNVELQSQIFGTPALASTFNSEQFVISCATDGSINFIDLTHGTIKHTHKLPGDIYSSPVIHENMIFVGCRDNLLYCIQF